MIQGKINSKGDLISPKEIQKQENLEIGKDVMFCAGNLTIKRKKIYTIQRTLK